MAERVDSVLGTEVVSPLTTVKMLAAIPFEADGVTRRPCRVRIQCDPFVGGVAGNAVRYTSDNSAPTSDYGFYLAPGSTVVTTTSLQSLKFLGVAAPARLHVQYEIYPGPHPA